MLHGLQLAWVNDIRHLSNYINKPLSDKLDYQYKLSTFIDSVNKLKAIFRNLQHDVIDRLFKSHCSFYGSQAWRIDSPDYKRICILWNKSVGNILKLPYTRHTWILGPLSGQPHMYCQLQQRTLRFCVQDRISIILWFRLVGIMQVTIQIHNLVITLHVLEIITVSTFCLVFVIRKLFALHV